MHMTSTDSSRLSCHEFEINIANEYDSMSHAKGEACIDRRKGIAHKLPEGALPDEQIPGIDEVAFR
jgi:nitrate/TMAO reductase-like tetraheme cytochrome c subunit